MSTGTFEDEDLYYVYKVDGTAKARPQDPGGIYGNVNYILPSFTVDGQLYLVTELDFSNCPDITRITIPQYVTKFKFTSSNRLNAINIDSNNTNFLVDNNVIFNNNKTTLMYYPFWITNSSYTIPSSVTAIGYGALANCTSLTSIVIPSSVTSIDNNAFMDSSSLTSIVIPNSVTSIGIEAFAGCSSLTSIIIPSSITSIPMYAFVYCSSLTKIVIPSSVTIIENYAFMGCDSLNSVFFLGDIPDIQKYYWEPKSVNFTKEVDSVYYITGAQNTDRLIPLFNSVYELSRQQMYTFGGNHLIPALFAGGVPVADLLTEGVSIYWLARLIPAASLLAAGVSAGTLMDEGFSLADLISAGLTSFYTDTNNVIYYYDTTGSRVVDSPNASGNIEIKSSITVNAVVYSVRAIISSAFKNNVNITGIIIPSTITYIGNRSFQGCTQLSNVYFKGRPVSQSDSFSVVYLPSNDPNVQVKANTAYIKQQYQPYPWSMPMDFYYLNQFFNIVYLESSVIDAFAFAPPAPPAPASPTGLVATISGTTATINFNQPSNGSPAVTSYTYATSSNNITYSSFVNTNLIKVSATQVSISGLTTNSTYYFKLIANNGSPSIESIASNRIFVRPPTQQLIQERASMTSMLNVGVTLQEMKDAGFTGNTPATATELLTSISFFAPPIIELSSNIVLPAKTVLSNTTTKPITLKNSGSTPIVITPSL